MTESEVACRKAIELNPHSAIAHYNLGLMLAQDPARLSEAETAYHKAIELEPNNAGYIYRLALLLHENLHRLDDAEIVYRQAIALAPEDPFFYSGLISLLVQQSRRFDVLPYSAKMRELLVANRNWYGLATLDAILGNTDAAIEHLSQAAGETTFNSQWARNDPDLASIRNDPRFDKIVNRSGLTQNEHFVR